MFQTEAKNELYNFRNTLRSMSYDEMLLAEKRYDNLFKKVFPEFNFQVKMGFDYLYPLGEFRTIKIKEEDEILLIPSSTPQVTKFYNVNFGKNTSVNPLMILEILHQNHFTKPEKQKARFFSFYQEIDSDVFVITFET